MKKLFVVLFALAGAIYANAQCTPPAPAGDPGLSPNWGCLDCVVQGSPYASVITIENFDSVGGIVIQSLRLDSLTNLPNGISYTVNPSNGTFPGGGTGCVDVTGTSNDTVGQYKLGIYVTVTLAGLGSFSGEAGEIVQNLIDLGIIDTSTTTVPNFDYYARVVANSGDCVIDDSCTAAIDELSSLFTKPVAQPNPFSAQTQISWNSNTDGKFTAKMFDVAGKEVYSQQLHVRIGTNNVTIERGTLPTGSYVFILTDGRKSISTKLMVRE